MSGKQFHCHYFLKAELNDSADSKIHVLEHYIFCFPWTPLSMVLCEMIPYLKAVPIVISYKIKRGIGDSQCFISGHTCKPSSHWILLWPYVLGCARMLKIQSRKKHCPYSNKLTIQCKPRYREDIATLASGLRRSNMKLESWISIINKNS